MAGVSYLVAFLAGIVSFLAPCVLPLVPGFLIYLAGTSAKEGSGKRWDIVLASILFVAGFSLVFSLLGVLLNTILNSVTYGVQLWLSRAGGLIIIFFGLYLVGLIRIGWLEQEHKFSVTGIKSKYLTSFVFGAAFAAGWTPCVGAALGAILGLAATQPGIAFTLLLAYSAGLGVPFDHHRAVCVTGGGLDQQIFPGAALRQHRFRHPVDRYRHPDLHADALPHRKPAGT